MRAADYARSVRHTLQSNRLRAALTLLGTVIGAASIVLLAGLLRSGEEMLIASAQGASESDLMRITTEVPSVNVASHQRRQLGRQDQALIAGSELLDHARVATSSSLEFSAEPYTSDDCPRNGRMDVATIRNPR